MNTTYGTSMLIMLLVSSLVTAAESLPDPTRPPDYALMPVVREQPVELTDWKVTAIRISESDRSAIVNGTIVRAGDMLGVAIVREILPDQVVLDLENKQLVVRLFNELIQRKPVTTEMKTKSESKT